MSTTDLDNLDFKIVKEEWNEYELKGDIKLRGRAFLTRLAENKNAPTPSGLKGEQAIQLTFSVEKKFQIFAPPILRGPPTKPIPRLDQIPEDKKEEIELLTYSEPWNVYEVLKNGGILKMKLVVSKVWKIKDTFDSFGEPYCVVNNNPIFNYEPPKDKNKFA